MPLLGELLADHQYDMAVQGVIRGIVKENWDDKHPGMVKVEILLGEQGKSVTGWAPVMTNYAGNEYGNYELPEVGHAVVLAFEMGNKNCPIVLGALWDKKNVLPKETANKDNSVKRFKTKGGIEVLFSEEKGKEKLVATTPGKLTIEMQDEKKTIECKDEKGENSILLDCDKGELTITAKKKLHIKIGTEEMVTIDSNSIQMKAKDIKNEAKSGYSVDAQNVKLAAKANVNVEGKAGVDLKASGSMKLNSNGILEVKGSMVKIN